MCHHKWLNRLDNNADHVRVVSFDLKKDFDSVSNNIAGKKLEKTNINSYIINWIANFLSDRRQRVIVNGTETNYVEVNKGVPQGTVLGPFLFSLMINDLTVKDSDRELIHPELVNVYSCSEIKCIAVVVVRQLGRKNPFH